MSGYWYQGIQGWVMPADGPDDPDHVPVYRAWNAQDGDHFYTSSQEEYEGLPELLKKEGIACLLAKTPLDGHIRVERFYNKDTRDHFYTAWGAEIASLKNNPKWIQEFSPGYIATWEAPGHVPLYRSYNGAICDHFITTSWDEISAESGDIVHKMIDFDPRLHGFQFPNSFEVSAKDLFPGFGFEISQWEMGLCGGMVAAAHHRFDRSIPVPTTATTPKSGDPLFQELLDRQIVCTLPILLKIYDWQRRNDTRHWWDWEDPLPALVRHEEWPKLQGRLDDGKLTQIVIIRVEGKLADISKNHQVLVTGYEVQTNTQQVKIYTYDPNERNMIHEITFELRGEYLRAQDSTGHRCRAFFVNTQGDAAAAIAARNLI